MTITCVAENNPTGTAPPGEAKFSNQRNRTFQGEPNRQHSFTSNESQKIGRQCIKRFITALSLKLIVSTL